MGFRLLTELFHQENLQCFSSLNLVADYNMPILSFRFMMSEFPVVQLNAWHQSRRASWGALPFRLAPAIVAKVHVLSWVLIPQDLLALTLEIQEIMQTQILTASKKNKYSQFLCIRLIICLVLSVPCPCVDIFIGFYCTHEIRILFIPLYDSVF